MVSNLERLALNDFDRSRAAFPSVLAIRRPVQAQQKPGHRVRRLFSIRYKCMLGWVVFRLRLIIVLAGMSFPEIPKLFRESLQQRGQAKAVE